MNRHSTPRKPLLELARRNRQRWISENRKVRRSRREPGDLLKIIKLVRGDANNTVRLERAMHRQEERFIDEPAWSMATLWPRIREHEMKYGNGIRGEKALHRVRNLNPQDAGVRQACALDLSASRANAPQQSLDSKKIPLRVHRGDSGEKRPVPATEIDFKRGAPAIDRR